MAKKARIPEPQTKNSNLENRRLQFTFKSLDERHPKFTLEKCNVEFFRALFLQLRTYSEYTEEQFREQNNDDHRHTNHWKDTTEPDGFAQLSEEIQDEYSWQFAVCPNSRTHPECDWRVHGMLLENIFYIVWLDPGHELDPLNNQHTGNQHRSRA